MCKYLRTTGWKPQEVIANSCNDAMMQIGAKMGVENFLKAQSTFNFGSRTGIDLPNEGYGIMHTVDTMAMRRELAVFCMLVADSGVAAYDSGNLVQCVRSSMCRLLLSSHISACCPILWRQSQRRQRLQPVRDSISPLSSEADHFFLAFPLISRRLSMLVASV
ncbi:MAG: penicillin-binding transpeptidase domain-containing protein [Ruminococcus sp.]